MSWKRVWHLALGFKTLAYSTVAVCFPPFSEAQFPFSQLCTCFCLLALQSFAKHWLFFFFFNLAKLHGLQDLSSPTRDWTPHPVLTTGLTRNSFYFLNLRLKIFLLKPIFPEDLIEKVFPCYCPLQSCLTAFLAAFVIWYYTFTVCFLLCNVCLPTLLHAETIVSLASSLPVPGQCSSMVGRSSVYVPTLYTHKGLPW